jgi:hypothetical protein
MTNLRPGLGSCTANWGTHDDRDLRDRLLRLDLLVSLRHLSDPARLGLAPRPVTEELPSNLKESVLDCGNFACRNDGKTVAARRPSED